MTAAIAPTTPGVFWRPSAALRVATGSRSDRCLAATVLAAITAFALLLATAPITSTLGSSFSESGVAAQTDPAQPLDAAEQPASPVVVGETGAWSYDSMSGCCVAPRTTPGTAIEPMWAQAPNRGFLGGWSRADTLEAGTVIDRYGGETGRFFSPQGTPLEARSLPAGSGSLNSYEVLKPLHVQGGVVAPAFGQPGLGIQYMTDLPVADLIEQGFLKAVG